MERKLFATMNNSDYKNFSIKIIVHDTYRFEYLSCAIRNSKLKNITAPINERIRASELMLIDQNGDKKGIVSIEEALDTARKASLDLVQVSSRFKSSCLQLMDYGKHLFSKKNVFSQSLNLKTVLKEIKFRPSTDTGDYNIKLKKIKSFILDKNKTKISVRFRGREILNSNLGLDLLNRIKEDLSEIAQVDQEPSLEGRQLLMVLSPLKQN